ncbi:MAG: type IV secretory system conjugative DNA transfer family protein [Pseudomonadota bacterium]|nr:conjugal transfer protein TraG [Magnetococcales bacterium]MEC8467915.1 type IV secretory system conjugative DNA transfer family protein [Pseudomonadota bacterium]|tara:strand:- start:12664 stop:14184 length:1521 start_codon:yes stop_codon:yes gene_type:complete
MSQKTFLYTALVVAAAIPFVVPEGLMIPAVVAAVVAMAYIYFKNRPKAGYKKQVGELKKMQGKASHAHGSADFATMKDLKEADLVRENGFMLGKFDNKFVRFRSPGHLITFAPTRSGKGVGHVIPNLLDHPGSVVVNDIKGENYAVSGRHRAQFSKVITFAPFMEGSGCFNPIDFIRINTSDELDDAALIADMIIVPGGGDEFWTNEAKTVITGLILYVANESPAALRNLGEVRYLIMQDQKDFQLTIKDMQRSKNQIIQRIANSVAATEPKVLASVLSTAKSQTAVWDSPRLTSITSRSDFKLEDIKKEPTSFYVIIPPEYLDVYKPVVRLMMGITIATLTRTQEKPKDPTLFIIDEFPALGYMKNIESGVGYLAGYGISLWMFIQDLSQIKEDYPKWASLIANCSVRMAFGTNDFDTAKILSDMMGTTTVRVAGEGTSKEKGQWFGGNVSSNVSETSRPLMTPDEVMRMPNDAQVIFVQGCRPVLAEKIRYYADPEFKGKFDAW